MHISNFVLSSVALLISYYAEMYRKADFERTLEELEPDLGLPVTHTFDFIVVGAGAAGAVVANRLSECYSVLLLEAGGTPPPPTMVPAFQNYVTEMQSLHFLYTSVPQSKASLSTEGVITRRPAKMLGGSTSHHGMVYNRGHPADYDNWATITNDSSWKYENILQYFKASEKYIGTLYSGGQHGTNGPLAVDDGVSPSTSLWFEAARELGFVCCDPNGPQIQSFAASSVTKENGRRVSTYTAFLEPIEKYRKNLKVLRYSEVSQILIDEEKKAFGVRYYRHGIPQIAHASKEIVVSAGAFASPLILMKSGIGSRELLEHARIPVVADLPVGQTLQDHIRLTLEPFHINDTSLFPSLFGNWTKDTIDKYLNNNGEGLLYWHQGSQMFMASSVAKRAGESNWPDLQILFKPGFFNQLNQSHEISFDIILGRSKSVGFISLNTTRYLNGVRDNGQLAILDYKLLEDDEDSDVLLEGIKMVMKIAENTTAFQRIGTTFSQVPNPSCKEHEFRSDEYWSCFIAQFSSTEYHMAGPCRMGYGPGDKNAVVDFRLKVIGVSNLRVADGSVMPRPPNANTAAPITMIGEKVSAMILEDWDARANSVNN